jgi:hypothetical protein
MRAGLPLIPLCALLAATGCQRFVAKPNIPQTVTVVVEKFKPLPEWATAQLPNAAPVDGTVRALLLSNDQRAATIDYANCRARLLSRLDKGEKPDLKECK